MLALSGLPLDTSGLLFPLAHLTPWVPDLATALRASESAFDLVGGMNIVFDALLAPAQQYARQRRIPFVLHPLTHLGESDDDRVRRYYTMQHQRRLLQESDAVIVQNAGEKRALIALGVPARLMVVAGSGVNPADLAGGDGERFRQKYGVQGPIVAYLGTAAYDKGANHSVEATTLLQRSGVPVTLVMAGPVMEQFSAFFAGQPDEVRRCCRLLGFVSEADKRDLLAACCMLVLPSRTDSFGIVFPEAWVYGKPVIGARAGGIPEVIDDGDNGLLVPFGDAGALAGAMARLLADPDLAQRLGENGRRKTMDSLTWDVKYATVRRVYENLGAGLPPDE